MIQYDLKALVQAKISDPYPDPDHDPSHDPFKVKKWPRKDHKRIMADERIRQTFESEDGGNFHWPESPLNRDPGVPEDAVMIFPSIRHEPDLMGFGVPSNALPGGIAIFGYWGYGLRLRKRFAMEWLELVRRPQSDPNDRHVLYWLSECHEEALADYREWVAGQCG